MRPRLSAIVRFVRTGLMVVGARKAGGGDVDRRRVLRIDEERGDDEAVAVGTAETRGEALPRSTAVIGAVGNAAGNDIDRRWIRRIDGERLHAARHRCTGLPRLASVERAIELPGRLHAQRVDDVRRRRRDGGAHHDGTSERSIRTAGGELRPRSGCGGREGEYEQPQRHRQRLV